jgi:hypothetical protein
LAGLNHVRQYVQLTHCDRIKGKQFHDAPISDSSDRISTPTSSSLDAPLISTFGPSSQSPETTMPSADFCVLTPHVSMRGAIGLIMSCCLFCVSHCKGLIPARQHRICLVPLVNRLNLFRNSLMNLLSRDAQTSPDKNVNFPCTNAAFTLPLEPEGFVVLCQLAQGLSLLCGFCLLRLRSGQALSRVVSLSNHCTPASFRPLLAETPLPSARTFVSIHYYEHLSVLVQGTFTP